MIFRIQINSDIFNITSYVFFLSKNKNNCLFTGQNSFSKQANFTIGFGEIEVLFEDYKLIFEHIEYPEIKALNNSTTKHSELFCKIEMETWEKASILFNKFFEEVKKFSAQKKDDVINIYIYRPNFGWIKQSELPKRNLETIYLNEKQKNDLIKDIDDFHTERSEYIKFGIPHKKVYLLAGLPGTGKSSLIFSLASKYNKTISTISFSPSLDDTNLMQALRNMEENCILLLEDIDALFLQRETNSQNKSSVSFSALLNILDGINRKDGLIIFLTTNHIEKLDQALKRPGRIDKILEFTFANKNQVKLMFDNFLPNQRDKFEGFYKSISNKKFTMSLVQQFLFKNRNCSNILDKLNDLEMLISFYDNPEWQQIHYT